MWKKFVAVSALFLFAAVTMAQSSEQDRVARMEKNLRRAAENYQAGPRKPYMTVNWFLEQIESGKEVSACAALSVISDEAYISSLDENTKT